MRASLLCVTVLALACRPAVLTALEPDRPLGEYGLDAWTPRQGLPSSFVNDLAQTPDGYLWLATYSGVVRFDGVTFTTYRAETTPGLDEDGIRALAVAPDGTLWIGTNGGGVSRVSGGRFERFGPAQGLPDPLVWAVHASAAGMWAGTSTGALFAFDGTAFVRQPRPGGAPIGALATEPSGVLWVGSYGGGLERRAPDGTWSTITSADGLPSDIVGSLVLDRDGALWVGTAGGVARVHGVRVEQFRLGYPGVPVWSVHVDREGTVWAAGARGHVARFREHRLEVVPASLGLPDGVIPSMLADEDGNLWLGTGGYGLLRLRDVSIVTRGRVAGLPSDLVLSVQPAASGGLLVATSSGLSQLHDDHALPLWRTPAPLRSVAVASDGTMWLGMDGAGVGRLKGGTWQLFGPDDGLGSDAVRAVVIDPRGVVWAATLGGLSRYEGGRWINLGREDGLGASAVLSLLVAGDGTVWGGTEGAGLFRVVAGRIETVAAQELQGAIVLGLAEAGPGALWAATSRGLAHVASGRVVLLGREAGITGAVAQVVTAPGGDVWICGSDGLQRLPHEALGSVVAGRVPALQPQVFGTVDGLGSPQCTTPAHPAGALDASGHMHFATYGGVSTVYPDRLHTDTRPPHVHVEEVRADGQLVGTVAGPGARRVEVRYTGISLRAPHAVAFRYRLEGFDPEWMDAGTERVARYTNLPPGRYRFRVTARNASGIWNETGATTDIELRPWFWQTPLFALACLVALAATALAGHRHRVRRLERREAELATLVAERTREMEAAVSRAERADAFKTRMLGIAAHDLKNPLTTLLASAQLLDHVDGDDRRELAAAMERSAQRTLRLVDDLLLVAALEAGRLDLVRRPVDLGALVAATRDDHTAAARRKQQTLALASEPGVEVDGDEDRLRQVADNLVGNAIKFSPPGATVSVVVRADGDVARIEVNDEGPGIPAGEAARLFDAFARLTPRPTTGEQSTGLGLSIVKQIVELHGGRVAAEDRSGGGTTFAVELPRRRVTSPS